MASTVDESDLDPAKFLQSVRELSDKREREDLERYRKLEEEIAQGRQLRLERKLGEWPTWRPVLQLDQESFTDTIFRTNRTRKINLAYQRLPRKHSIRCWLTYRHTGQCW